MKVSLRYVVEELKRCLVAARSQCDIGRRESLSMELVDDCLTPLPSRKMHSESTTSEISGMV